MRTSRDVFDLKSRHIYDGKQIHSHDSTVSRVGSSHVNLESNPVIAKFDVNPFAEPQYATFEFEVLFLVLIHHIYGIMIQNETIGAKINVVNIDYKLITKFNTEKRYGDPMCYIPEGRGNPITGDVYNFGNYCAGTTSLGRPEWEMDNCCLWDHEFNKLCSKSVTGQRAGFSFYSSNKTELQYGYYSAVIDINIKQNCFHSSVRDGCNATVHCNTNPQRLTCNRGQVENFPPTCVYDGTYGDTDQYLLVFESNCYLYELQSSQIITGGDHFPENNWRGSKVLVYQDQVDWKFDITMVISCVKAGEQVEIECTYDDDDVSSITVRTYKYPLFVNGFEFYTQYRRTIVPANVTSALGDKLVIIKSRCVVELTTTNHT